MTLAHLIRGMLRRALWLISRGRAAARKRWIGFMQPMIEIGPEVNIEAGVRFRVDRSARVLLQGKTELERGVTLDAASGSLVSLDSTRVSSGTFIKTYHGATFEAEHAFLGINCVVVAHERITMLEGAMVGEMCVIRDQDHAFKLGVKVEDSPYVTAPILIGRETRVLSSATILKGVTVGDNSIIAAHALVNRDVPPNSVYGGIPARPLTTTRVVESPREESAGAGG